MHAGYCVHYFDARELQKGETKNKLRENEMQMNKEIWYDAIYMEWCLTVQK